MFNITSHQGNANQPHNKRAHPPIRTAEIKHHDNTNYWQGCRETRSRKYFWWECKMMHLCWKRVWKFLQNQLCCYHMTQPQHSWAFITENCNLCACRNLSVNAHYSFICVAPNQKKNRCPLVGEGVNKLRDLQTMASSSAIKRSNLSIHETSWMNCQRIRLGKKLTPNGCMLPFIQHS